MYEASQHYFYTDSADHETASVYEIIDFWRIIITSIIIIIVIIIIVISIIIISVTHRLPYCSLYIGQWINVLELW